MAKGPKSKWGIPIPGPGRPSGYSKELADKICDAVATTAAGMKKICDSRSDFPDQMTVIHWRRAHPEFEAAFWAAKKEQAELKADMAWEIVEQSTSETVQVDLLKFKVLQWHAGSLNQRYAKRTTLAGDESAPLVVEQVTRRIVD